MPVRPTGRWGRRFGASASMSVARLLSIIRRSLPRPGCARQGIRIEHASYLRTGLAPDALQQSWIGHVLEEYRRHAGLAYLPYQRGHAGGARVGLVAQPDRGDELQAVGAGEVAESVVRGDNPSPLGWEARHGPADLGVQFLQGGFEGVRIAAIGVAAGRVGGAQRSLDVVRVQGSRCEGPARHAGRDRHDRGRRDHGARRPCAARPAAITTS